MRQKLWKLAGSRQSYCKNYLAYFLLNWIIGMLLTMFIKWTNDQTCQTPTSAFAIRIRSITNGSTKAVSCSSDSSNHANTCQTSTIHTILTRSSAIAVIADCTAHDRGQQEYFLTHSFELKSAFAARQLLSWLLFFVALYPTAKVSEEVNRKCIDKKPTVHLSTPTPTLSATIHNVSHRHQHHAKNQSCSTIG